MTKPTLTRMRSRRAKKEVSSGLVLLVLLSPCVASGEGALYDPVPPPGSAFVRVHHSAPDPLTELNVPDKQIPTIAGYGTSSYFVLPAGRHVLGIGPQDVTVDAPEGGFVTVVNNASDGSARSEVDPTLSTQTKALVLLYNVNVSGAVSLKTSNGAVALIENQSASGVGSREVNAVKAPLAVFDSSNQKVELGTVVLKRGAAYGVFVSSKDGRLSARWVESETNTRM